ncbi:hypothetical protein D9M68_681780 [compost metagenome]
MGAAANGGDDALALPLEAAFELAADHAGLAPGLAFGQFAVGGEAGQLGAGAGAAGRAVVGLARAEHEVAAVGVRVVGEQLDMVDRPAVFATDVLVFQGLHHCAGIGGEGVEVVAGDALAVVGDEEEPVAAPGDIAGDAAEPGHVQAHVLAVAVGRHVAHAHRTVVVQGGFHRAHRGFDAVHARLDASQVRQRGHQPDGAVAAHAEVAAVVEKDDSGTGLRVHRLAEQGAHEHVAATGFEHGGGAPVVEPLGEQSPALGHVALAEVREPLDHQAGRLAAGVRVNDADCLHGSLPLLWISAARVAPPGRWRLEGFLPGL